MRALLLLPLSCVAACVGMSVPTASTSQSLGGLEKDVNRLGSDYRSFDLPAADPDLCAAACDDDPRCKAFTYVRPGLQGPNAKCWLKDPAPPGLPNESCCVSGAKPEAPSP